MRLSQVVPFALMAVAALALLLAIWFAVRRPHSSPATRQRRSWQVSQAALSALSASIAAVCVLLAVGAM